jgi:hypothetical protein
VGILKKTFRGMFRQKISNLNWDEIERRRVRYIPKLRDQQPPTRDDDYPGEGGDDQEDDHPPDVRDTALVNELAERIRGFDLPAILKPIDTVISGLREKFPFEDIQHAIGHPEKVQLASIVGARNPAGYLRTVLRTAISDRIAAGATADQDDASEEGSGLTQHEETLLDEAADWFYYLNSGGDDPGQGFIREQYKLLIPIFRRKVDRADLELLAFQPEPHGDAKSYRGIQVERAALTFIKQLQQWKDRL